MKAGSRASWKKNFARNWVEEVKELQKYHAAQVRLYEKQIADLSRVVSKGDPLDIGFH